MSLFDDHIVKSWNRLAEKRLSEGFALCKLWTMRKELGVGAELFIMKQDQLTDPGSGDYFIVGDQEYKIEDIEYGHLYVREL